MVTGYILRAALAGKGMVPSGAIGDAIPWDAVFELKIRDTVAPIIEHG